MSITALPSPIVAFVDGGVLPLSSANQNPDAAPSTFQEAVALLDPRAPYTYYPGMADSPVGFDSAGGAINAAPMLGWLISEVQAVDYAPSTISTNSISTSHALSSTALTLVTASGAGITVGDSITNALTGATVTGLLRIDNKPNYVKFGQGAVGMWDPLNPALGRAVSITSASTLTALTFTVSGYDAYGYPQTAAVTGPDASATVTSTKTFKWISSITVNTTSTLSASAGTADIFGFPLRVDRFAYARMTWNSIPQTASTFTAADTTSPAVATSGDVRGTWTNGGSATNNALRLQVFITVPVANISSNTGLVGVQPA